MSGRGRGKGTQGQGGGGKGKGGKRQGQGQKQPGGKKAGQDGACRRHHKAKGQKARKGTREAQKGATAQTDMKENKPPAQEYTSQEEIEKTPHLLFTSNTSFEQHYMAQTLDSHKYLATIQVLLKSGVEISQNVRVKCLAAAWARSDHALADTLLKDRDHFMLVEVLKALTMLDAGRRIRERKRQLRNLRSLVHDYYTNVDGRKISKVKSDILNLQLVKAKVGSVSGALIRHVRRWVRELTAAQLEFYALHYPKEPWKKLADICHLHSTEDFPEKPWFLPYCFGKPAPQTSLVVRCEGVNARSVNNLVKDCDVPYAHIKQFTEALKRASKVRIASYEERLDTLLWYYEDLSCPPVDKVICERLGKGETVALPTAKLMERMLTMKINRIGGKVMDQLTPMAENRLKEMSISLAAPVAILGDRSPSMDIAIRTSTIIACLLTKITNAKLSFFSNTNYDPPKLPKTIPEVLTMASSLRTEGSTVPAASLWPYYDRKEVVRTFVVVTDEEENLAFKGYRFAQLFRKYCDEVYRAKLVFISFLPGQHNTGQMVSELRAEGIQPLQFRFSGERPDLSKLDGILALLSLDTEEFREKVASATEGLSKLSI